MLYLAFNVCVCVCRAFSLVRVLFSYNIHNERGIYKKKVICQIAIKLLMEHSSPRGGGAALSVESNPNLKYVEIIILV